MSDSDDFFVPDESVEDVRAAFERGQKGKTRRPERSTVYAFCWSSSSGGVTLHGAGTQALASAKRNIRVTSGSEHISFGDGLVATTR